LPHALDGWVVKFDTMSRRVGRCASTACLLYRSNSQESVGDSNLTLIVIDYRFHLLETSR